MKKVILLNFVLLLVTAALAPAAEGWIEDVHIDSCSVTVTDKVSSVQKGPAFEVADKASYKPGELIVRFAAAADGKLRSTGENNQILNAVGGGTIIRNFRIVPGLSVVKLPTGMTVEEALQKLGKAKGVLYAEPDYRVSAFSTLPNDPRFNDLWGMHNTGQTGGTVDADIDAPEAWDISTGSSEITVAVIDTGVDYNHPDLAANMWVNSGEIPGNNIDDDDNGYVDDIYGYDFCNNDADPMDDHYHGTHCAGTIGAVGDNGEGVAGVCWNVRIMAMKFLSSGGSGWSSDAIDCIEYSVQMGAKVLSNSWGGGPCLHSLKDAIDAAGEAGVLFVAAAGNDNVNNDVKPHYPSSYGCENIIAVLSTDKNDNKSGFSCYGPNSVDLGAPGSSILSCEPGNTYDYHSGTSMATPHVAGACALVLSLNSWLDYPEVKDILLQTVDLTLPGLCVSGGRFNLYEAMMQVPSLGEGFINLDKQLYSCADEVSIEMGDSHLQGAGSRDVNVTTDGGDFETVTLVEDADRLGIFTGTISTSTDPVTVEDGTLQVSHGETITATYYDANDGTGNPATVEDTATVDCEPPSIFNISIEKVGGAGARIEFETDELSTGRIRCGLACGEPYTTESIDSELATTHSIKVSGLASETTYYFVVDVNDIVGNPATDTNDGNCYSFTTTTIQVVYVPDDFNTIQVAIDNVWDGDTVIVADGTYTGPGNRDIDFKGQAITVRSENGPDNCIIDCQGDQNEPHRGFYFHNGEGTSSVLAGFTITNGYGGLVCKEYGCFSCGGGIYSHNSNPMIDNCIICGNSAEEGGGMFNFENSGPTVSDCIFSGNSADFYGGGMHNRRSSPTLTNCTFSGNSACINSILYPGGGGGMYNFDCNPTLTNCTFSNNSTYDYNGGGMSNTFSSPTLTNCNFSGNSAHHFGGGMSNEGSSPTLTNCTFSSNSAAFGGGMSDVIAVLGVSSPALTNRKFSGIWAEDGWMNNNSGGPMLTNCTFNANTARLSGGGISSLGWGSTPTVSNCILWGDTPNELYVLEGTGETPVVTYSDIEGGWSGDGNNNIDADPCFVDAANGDYHLQSELGRWDPNQNQWVTDANTSRCIDAGDPNSDWTKELWPHGKCINIGAFGGTPQASMSLSEAGNVADLNNNGLVDYADLKLLADIWLCEDVLLSEDLDRNGIVDFKDFGIFAQEWSDAYLPEAGMSYQIGECGEEASALFAVEQSGQTRFTVAVEGQYIHFEDMIRANCCPGELWLEMTVDDYLIRIYEFEEMEGCWCICDFPTTAMLGPFADGDYLFEVIDVYGDSLGVVLVTIGGP